MICSNTACNNEIVNRRSSALYCCPNCKRQAEVARRAVKKTGIVPNHRGANDGRAANRRAASLRIKYGITLEQYEELLAKQGNACAICQKPADYFKTNLAVDHDHMTGEIRGLLCYPCNHKLVGRWREGTILRRIADYVDQGTGWKVPDAFLKGRPRKRKKKKLSGKS